MSEEPKLSKEKIKEKPKMEYRNSCEINFPPMFPNVLSGTDLSNVYSSPQNKKRKMEDPIEGFENFELNTKNFPSKESITKGRSNTVTKRPENFRPMIPISNSPIANYYAGVTQRRTSNGEMDLAQFSLEDNLEKGINQKNFKNRDSIISLGSQNFDFSPSNIFIDPSNSSSVNRITGSPLRLYQVDQSPDDEERNKEDQGPEENDFCLISLQDGFNSPDGIKRTSGILANTSLNENNLRMSGSSQNNQGMGLYNLYGNNSQNYPEKNNEGISDFMNSSEGYLPIQSAMIKKSLNIPKAEDSDDIDKYYNNSNFETNINNTLNQLNRLSLSQEEQNNINSMNQLYGNYQNQNSLDFPQTNLNTGNSENKNIQSKEENLNDFENVLQNEKETQNLNKNEMENYSLPQNLNQFQDYSNFYENIPYKTKMPLNSLYPNPKTAQYIPGQNPNNININNAYYSKYISNYYINNMPNLQQNQQPNIPKNIPNMMMNNYNNPMFYQQYQSQMNPNEEYLNQQMYGNQMNMNMLNNLNMNIGKKKKKNKIKRLDPNSYQDKPIQSLALYLNSLAKDQGGCRYLQKLLDEDPMTVTSELYPPLYANILNLINDPFANYLIQKMFVAMNEKQKEEIIEKISPSLFEIGSNSHGTRVLQSLINFLNTEKLIKKFLSALVPNVIPLIKELNGTHVVQLFTKTFPSYSDIINKIIVENCHLLAIHRHGCCVLQKYLQTSEEEMLLGLIKQLIKNCLDLVVDQFGNYVIQSILLMKNISYGNEITRKITENVCFYAKHKYSSNVVEKCLDHCDGQTKQKLFEKLTQKENIQDLILDEHGNYIVQKVLSTQDPETQKNMINAILPLMERISTLNYGERIINRLNMTYPQLKTMRPRKGFNPMMKMGFTEENNY
ncbi:MAG: hypothetical protein MJ252_10525 [archaeon]|nr:hypothetical protein [archaeon]